MFRILIILTFFINIAFLQDRSTIFNTGSPDGTEGFLIDNNHSVANRFSISNDYVLEAMVFYVSQQSIFGNVTVSIRNDDDNSPGELVSDLSIWEFQLDPQNQNNYNLIVTTDLCIYLDADNYYWWLIEATDELTEATWIYSNGSLYYNATTDDNGETWTSQFGYAGAGGIWAEQIFENATLQGDVNQDFVLNIIDIVTIVNYVTGNTEFEQEQFDIADLNSDGIINVIDIVQLVNIILSPIHANPDFILEDVNPSSEYFGENLGPSFFNSQVSCYYFGKQG